LFTR